MNDSKEFNRLSKLINKIINLKNYMIDPTQNYPPCSVCNNPANNFSYYNKKIMCGKCFDNTVCTVCKLYFKIDSMDLCSKCLRRHQSNKYYLYIQ
jgi:hypothetical protein